MVLRLAFFYGVRSGSIVWFSSCGFLVGDFYGVRGGSSNGVHHVGLGLGFFFDGLGIEVWVVMAWVLEGGRAWLEHGNGHR